MHALFSSFSLGTPRLSITKLSQHADCSRRQGYCLGAVAGLPEGGIGVDVEGYIHDRVCGYMVELYRV